MATKEEVVAELMERLKDPTLSKQKFLDIQAMIESTQKLEG